MMNNFGYFLVLSFSFFLAADSQYYQCLNPQNAYGYCVPLSYCPYIGNILRIYSQNSDAQNFVRRSLCAIIDKRSQQQLVCCSQNQLKLPSQVQQQAQDRVFNKNPSTKNVVQSQQQVGSENVQQFQQQTISDTSSAHLTKCGFDLDNRIFGGTKSNINDINWLALLRYSRPGSSLPSFKCAGSLINNRYVLTAAHCVHPKILQNTKLISVRLGEHDLSTDEDCQTINGRQICSPAALDIPISEVIIHEKYSPQSLNQFNDIALIRLARKVQFNDFIKPICLQSNKSVTITELLGQSLVVAGFGQTENHQNSNIKLQVTISVVQNELCNRIFRGEGRRLGDAQICAGGISNRDSCKGDSGGPLMKLVNQNGQLFWQLYGIVSYGSSPCGLQGNPAVYTKVDQFVEWIESKLKA